MHENWDVQRVGFNPYPFRSAFNTTIDMMRRMVVDASAALPEKLALLKGEDIANEIVDYDLVAEGMTAVGGPAAFDLTDADLESREQEYEILLKKK